MCGSQKLRAQRTGIDIAALAAARRAQSPTPEPSVAATTTADVGALATPAAPATPDASRSDDRPGGRPDFFPWRPGNDPDPTATETPRTSDRDSGDRDQDQDRDRNDDADRDRDRDQDRDEARRWEEALRTALRSRDDCALMAVLRETLTGDPDVDEERIEAILEATEDRDTRRRIARLLASEPGLATAVALRDALNEAERGAGDFVGERIAPLPTPALPVQPPLLPSRDNEDGRDGNPDRDRNSDDGRWPFPGRR